MRFREFEGGGVVERVFRPDFEGGEFRELLIIYIIVPLKKKIYIKKLLAYRQARQALATPLVSILIPLHTR